MTSDLARTRELDGEEGEDTETVPVELRRSNCSTPSVNSTSALEDMLLRMENRLSHNLSKGQQLLAQETSVALEKLTESQAQLSYQLIAQTA